MRHDMARVIVERPRLGAGRARKGRALDADDLPDHEGMRWPHRSNRKGLNEHLGPLKRFLNSRVGQRWDKVYAEISAHLRPDSTVQQHVRDHLDDFVLLQPGRPARPRYRGWDDRPWHEPFYVDPVDGVLKRTDDLPELRAARRAERNRPKPPPDRIPLGPKAELRRIDGFWYEIRFAPLPEPVYVTVTETRKVALQPWRANSRVVEVKRMERRLTTPPVLDVLSGEYVHAGPGCDEKRAWQRFRAEHPGRRYAVAKRRLSRAALRRHGLADQLPAI